MRWVLFLRVVWLLPVPVLFLFVSQGTVHAAYEAFLKFEGPELKGEVQDPDYESWINVLSFSWEASHDGSHGPGSVGNLIISKPLDRTSPSLFLQCVQGKHFAEARLRIRKLGGEKELFYEIALQGVYVRSIETEGSQSQERPTEVLSLSFLRIEVTYVGQLPCGTSEITSAWWDLNSNTGGWGN